MGILKTQNRKQAVIVQRMIWAVASYIVYFFIGLAAVQKGILNIPLNHYLYAFVYIFFMQGVFYVLVISGYYERWSDSAFVFFQILFGFVVLSYFMFFVDSLVRGILINVSLVGLLFGIFALKPRHFIIVATIPIGIFTILIVRDYFQGNIGDTLPVIALQWVVTVVMIITFSGIGTYLSGLRKKLRSNRETLKRQKERLEVTHRELQSVLRQMSEKAVRDELTGLYNRHQLSETIHAQINVAQGSGRPLGVLIIDVDHFKQVNDTHGHLVGDEILRAFIKIPENCLRKADFLARYGGEEFVVLLPNADFPTLVEIAERIRIFIESMVFDDIEKGFGVTVSIGATHYRDRETVEDMMARADQGLYQAKDGGRNQVVYNQ